MVVILALKNAPPYKSLEISTRSEYAIRSVAYYAAKMKYAGGAVKTETSPKSPSPISKVGQLRFNFFTSRRRMPI
jgi:hypothetical protein